MGKTIIDTELRNEVVQFLGACRLPGYTYNLDYVTDLYFRMRPKRLRKAKEKDNGFVSPGFVTADGSPVDLTQAMTNLA